MARERAIDGSFSMQKIGWIRKEGMDEKSGLVVFLRKDRLPCGKIGDISHHGTITFLHELAVTICSIEEQVGIKMHQPESILDGKTDRLTHMEGDLAIDPHQDMQSRP